MVRVGQLVVNRLQANNGLVFDSGLEGLVSPDYSVFDSRVPIRMDYLSQVLRTAHYRAHFRRESTGLGTGSAGFLRLYDDRFLQTTVAMPPVPEQVAIVCYLDHVDRRIRRYIRAKQRLIALLEEQKQTIIHRAVTRGLDPVVRVKPSGVEWLGDVPEHWIVRRFKFLTRIASGQVDPRLADHKNKVLIAPNHIRSGSGQITRLVTADEQGADSGKYEVRSGQIVYSKIRPALRKAAIAPFNCLCSADMYPITVREDLLRPTFFLHLLLSKPFTRYAVDCSLRVAMPKVNREAVGNGWLWFPGLDEQDRILDSINAVGAPLVGAMDRVQGQIALNREYRARLIVDVVTGKLDVREAAAGLPEETDEPEPVEDAHTLGNDNDAEDGTELDADAGESTDA